MCSFYLLFVFQLFAHRQKNGPKWQCVIACVFGLEKHQIPSKYLVSTLGWISAGIVKICFSENVILSVHWGLLSYCFSVGQVWACSGLIALLSLFLHLPILTSALCNLTNLACPFSICLLTQASLCTPVSIASGCIWLWPCCGCQRPSAVIQTNVCVSTRSTSHTWPWLFLSSRGLYFCQNVFCLYSLELTCEYMLIPVVIDSGLTIIF